MDHTLRDKIRSNWTGDDCDHKEYDRVYYYNHRTEYYACLRCGLLMTEKDIDGSDPEAATPAKPDDNPPGE